MVEYWDIYDESGAKTGELISRDEWLKEGQYHLVVHIWIKNRQGNWLIQKRADHLDWSPGMWAATGGSAISGEDSLAAAIRETAEELGLSISAGHMKCISRITRQTAFTDIWIAECDVLPRDLILEDAVSDVKYVSVPELKEMIRTGAFVDYTSGEMYTEEVMEYLYSL